MIYKKIIKTIVCTSLAALTLVGCDNKSAPLTLADIEQKGVAYIDHNTKGFYVGGSSLSRNTMLVFYDMQCPHCGHFWGEVGKYTKDHKGGLRFKWIPVGMLNKASVAQGATILGSVNQKDLMDKHEESLLNRLGGISAEPALVAKFTEQVTANTDMMAPLIDEEHNGVPLLVYVDKNGHMLRKSGGMSATDLASVSCSNYGMCDK